MLMEQHFSSVRLFGGKSVAFILGILSIFGFSSAMAEKLDTTFVLDMVVDNTPCYYVKYNRTGQIFDYGYYYGSGDYFRLNVGYVTDQSGKAVDTLYYVCDEVTKQWRKKEINSPAVLHGVVPNENSFYENGMMSKLINPFFPDEIKYRQFSLDGFVVEDYGHRATHYTDNQVYTETHLYDNYGNITKYTYCYSEYHEAGSFWIISGENDTKFYTNSYENDNLVSRKITTKTEMYNKPQEESFRTEQYYYDSLNRRIKTENYDMNGILTDSIVYMYGPMIKEPKPQSFLFIGNNTAPSQYDLSDYYLCEIPNGFLDIKNQDRKSSKFYWNKSKYATDIVSYDAETGIVTITVRGADYATDSNNFHEYQILTKKIDSLLISQIIYKDEWVNVEGDNRVYDMFVAQPAETGSLEIYHRPIIFSLRCETDFSDLTHTLTLIFSPEVNAALTDTFYLKFHPFIELTSIDDKDGETYSFAADKFEYESDWKYNPSLVKYDAPDDVTVTRSYDESTGVLTLTARFANDTTQKTEYRIQYAIRQMQSPCINSLFVEEISVDTFASDKYEYEFDREYEPRLVKYVLPDGIAVTESYDDSTGILKVTAYYVNDTIQTTEYKIHFRPTNGVDDFGGDNVRLYVVDRTICVDGLQSSLSVYDMMGRLVGTGSGESVRVPVQSGGVYVVTSDGNSVKVVVG